MHDRQARGDAPGAAPLASPALVLVDPRSSVPQGYSPLEAQHAFRRAAWQNGWAPAPPAVPAAAAAAAADACLAMLPAVPSHWELSDALLAGQAVYVELPLPGQAGQPGSAGQVSPRPSALSPPPCQPSLSSAALRLLRRSAWERQHEPQGTRQARRGRPSALAVAECTQALPSISRRSVSRRERRCARRSTCCSCSTRSHTQTPGCCASSGCRTWGCGAATAGKRALLNA